MNDALVARLLQCGGCSASHDLHYSRKGWLGIHARPPRPALHIYVNAGVSVETVDAMLAIVRSFAPRAPKDVVLRALAKVYYLTASKKEDGEDLTLRFAAWEDQLSAFPGDVVLAVLRDWPNDNRYWPTWDAIRPKLLAAAGFRAMAAERLERLAEHKRR